MHITVSCPHRLTLWDWFKGKCWRQECASFRDHLHHEVCNSEIEVELELEGGQHRSTGYYYPTTYDVQCQYGHRLSFVEDGKLRLDIDDSVYEETVEYQWYNSLTSDPDPED
jgi:hypothetical protein